MTVRQFSLVPEWTPPEIAQIASSLRLLEHEPSAFVGTHAALGERLTVERLKENMERVYNPRPS